MNQEKLFPDYIFEASWEVCNKVGGIYTVLSTRAKTLQDMMPDHIFFVGPDFWQDKENPLFVEDKTLFQTWNKKAAKENLTLRIGRWQIPGKPIAILVDFRPFFAYKNDIYGGLWRDFQVDSLHGYGDYDEASMFSYAAARVVESFYQFYLNKQQRVIYQAHEWMTGLGALYLQKHVPQIASIFTTHATTIGRSIAGNGKPLYQYLFAYNGNQMASELNVESKHSIERQTAHHTDCFTTVSDVTARECLELLDKQPDVVLPNGFEMDFVPQGRRFSVARNRARKRILEVANALMGTEMADDTLIISTSGRYEWKNKGIDVYLEGMDRLRQRAEELQRPVLALVEVPAWQAGPREDLMEKLKSGKVLEGSSVPLGRAETLKDTSSNEEQMEKLKSGKVETLKDTSSNEDQQDKPSTFQRFNVSTSLPEPYITHVLREPWNDPATATLRAKGFENKPEDMVKVMFVPCYLDGQDGIFNLHYYDLLVGLDMTVYPSYYEPWGYTPLESVAFHVPCLTTSLAGFGLWAEEQNKLKSGKVLEGSSVPLGRAETLKDTSIKEDQQDKPSTFQRFNVSTLDLDGVEVIERTDYNFDEVADRIASEVIGFAALKTKQVEVAREAAAALAEKAQWKYFIQYYLQAYDIALRNAAVRSQAR